MKTAAPYILCLLLPLVFPGYVSFLVALVLMFIYRRPSLLLSSAIVTDITFSLPHHLFFGSRGLYTFIALLVCLIYIFVLPMTRYYNENT